MVANTIHRTRPQYSQRDLERMEQPEFEDDSDDSVDRQKVSVAPDSDKVTTSAIPCPFCSLDGHTDTRVRGSGSVVGCYTSSSFLTPLRDARFVLPFVYVLVPIPTGPGTLSLVL